MNLFPRVLPLCSIQHAVVAAALVFAGAARAMGSEPFDVLLIGGMVIDGTGSMARQADVGVRDGRIAAIGDLATEVSVQRLRVDGQVVAPGFIDVHSHADRALAVEEARSMEGLLRQGITTVVFGIDGSASIDTLRANAALAERGEVGVNFLSYIGHNGVRRAVMGMKPRSAEPDEIAAMQDVVQEAMEFGAVGLSTGLMYLPGRFASTEEVVALAKVTAPFGGRYDSHVRDPVNDLLASHRECLEIGAAAGVHAHPTHIKAVGSKNFGKGPALVALIEERLEAGQELSVDLYPYTGAATAPVAHLLYPGTEARGEALMARVGAVLKGQNGDGAVAALLEDLRSYWDDNAGDGVVLASARERTENPPEGLFSWVNTVGYASLRVVVSDNPAYEGELVTALAEREGISPFEFLRRMIVAEGETAMVTLGAIQEEDVQVLLKQPWAMVASDGEELDPSHPRGRGTFPRLLGRYARDWGVLSLEEAVHKISGLPASYLALVDRGVLREGAIADITVFDPDTIVDRATWAEPGLYASGVSHVFLGGRAALLDGKLQPERLGRYLPFRGDARQTRAPAANPSRGQ